MFFFIQFFVVKLKLLFAFTNISLMKVDLWTFDSNLMMNSKTQ
jgi:hypothetical protein